LLLLLPLLLLVCCSLGGLVCRHRCCCWCMGLCWFQVWQVSWCLNLHCVWACGGLLLLLLLPVQVLVAVV
jgi:hypothetical protein